MRAVVWTLLLAASGWGCASSKPPAPAPAAAPRTDTSRAAVARSWIPALDVPRADRAGRVAWSRAPVPMRADVGVVYSRLADGDTLGAWSDPAAQRDLEAYALRQSARVWLDRGDTLRADAALGRLAGIGSPWAWEALRQRTDLALAAGRNAWADSLLEAADREGWGDLDRAAWLGRRAGLRAELRDTTLALDFCRQLMRRYPSAPPAGQGVTLLEALLEARRERLSVDESVDAAEVAAFRGERRAAAERLVATRDRAAAERRWSIGLRAGELLRQDRSYTACRRALRRALGDASEPDDRGRVMLELARLERDAGAVEAGFGEYRLALATSRAPAQRAVAAWEYALELDAAGRGAQARAAYRSSARAGGPRAAEAALRVALSWLSEGRRDSAGALLRDASDDASLFWRATLRPAAEGAVADSELRVVASRPGYGFYAVAARETLGVRGWNGDVARDGCAHAAACAPLDRAMDLAMLGAADDAMTLVSRWASTAARDARLAVGAPPGGAPMDVTRVAPGAPAAVTDPLAEDLPPGLVEPAGLVPALLRASRVAYNAGRFPTGIRMAQRAVDAAGASNRWSVTPWLYPPAFDSLYRAMPDSMWRSGITVELARAVAWQESRFDPQARSRSDALGLYQLKLPTAGDVARWLGEPPPTVARLFDPARSIRYGVAYLDWLRRRFDGNALVAVAAYNSGPSAVSPTWRRDLDNGGVALFYERIGRAETRDYVRRIAGARAAYRELAPHTD